MPRADKKCVLLFEEANGDDLPKTWYLGWNVLKNHCWIFDYDNEVIAFSNVNA